MKRRLWPDSFFARLACLSVGAVVLSHFLFFITFPILREFRDPLGQPPNALEHRGHPPRDRDGLRTPEPPRTEGWPREMPPPPGEGEAPPGPRPDPGPRIHMGVWVGLGIQFGLMLVVAWIGARLLARPVQRLGEAARNLSEHLDTPPLPLEGPAEARAAAQAFNAMQARIRRQMEERARFLAAVSHDLRTPLTRMQLRVARVEEGDIRSKLTEDIAEMADMLNATLSYLRGDAQPERREMMDIQSLLESMVEDAQDLGSAVSLNGSAAPLQAEPQALRRCIANLIENALRYGGNAEISLKDDAQRLVVEISDRGPGIPPEHLEAVFEPYRRLETSRNRSTGGVGLGLAIARETARRHGGSLSLHNREGGGLIARLELPRPEQGAS